MVAAAVLAVFLLLVMNAVVYRPIIRPIRNIVTVADELRVGNDAAGSFPSGGATQITALTRAFERLRTSLKKALHLLEPPA